MTNEKPRLPKNAKPSESSATTRGAKKSKSLDESTTQSEAVVVEHHEAQPRNDSARTMLVAGAVATSILISFSAGTLVGSNLSKQDKEPTATVENVDTVRLRLQAWNTQIVNTVVGVKEDLATVKTLKPSEIRVTCTRVQSATKLFASAAESAPVAEVGAALEKWTTALKDGLKGCTATSSDDELKKTADLLYATEPLFIKFSEVFNKYVASAPPPSQ